MVSDVESDTEKGATSDNPEPFSASVDQTFDPPKSRIPKVTSDSFISELVSDREPSKNIRDVTPAVLEEEEFTAPSAGGATPSPLDPQWSNVDLEEAQVQQPQPGPALESSDTCSLSSVATYTLALEDSYVADERPLWAWMSGGGCNVDSHSQISWFNCSINTSSEFSLK